MTALAHTHARTQTRAAAAAAVAVVSHMFIRICSDLDQISITLLFSATRATIDCATSLRVLFMLCNATAFTFQLRVN